MKPTQSGESKIFFPLWRGQGALRAHLYPRRLLDEHNVWSIYPPLCKEGEIRGDRLLDVMTPEGKSLGWGATYPPRPLVPSEDPPGRTFRSGSAISTSSMKADWWAPCGPGAGSKWTEAWPELCYTSTQSRFSFIISYQLCSVFGHHESSLTGHRPHYSSTHRWLRLYTPLPLLYYNIM